MPASSSPSIAQLFAPGAVIPAHPLALDANGAVDWTSQRALTRYYFDAGAHGVAVGVHTTQFALHNDQALLADVWTNAVEVAAAVQRPVCLVAGVRGRADSAQREAGVAVELGYHAALLSPAPDASDDEVLTMAAAVGEVMPTLGFYMQDDVGGRYLGIDFWRSLFAQPAIIGVKIAAFDRYRTGEVMRALLESGRDDVALLTGNDDNIIADLATTYSSAGRSAAFTGGLLGQWAVGTKAAVDWSARAAAARTSGSVSADVLTAGTWITEINGAVFDVRNRFAGCVPGVNEVLRQQGLVGTSVCLSDVDRLSPGQLEEIAEMRRRYPELLDETFIAQNVERWRA